MGGAKPPAGAEDLEVAVQYGMVCHDGWYKLTTKGKKIVKAWQEGGVKLVIPFYANQTSVNMPEFAIFGNEWETEPKYRFGRESATVCLKSSFGDFFIWQLNKIIDQGVKGIYIDSLGTVACKNQKHGCGYIDENGQIKPTIGLFEAREIYKRMYILFKTKVPNSFIFNHAVPISPLASFVEGTTEGEEWKNRKLDYSFLTPDFFRCSYMTYRQLGISYLFYPGLYVSDRVKPTPLKDIIPLTLSHNVYPLPYRLSLFKPIWRIMDNWYTTSEWIPYWKNSHLVKSFAKEVKVNIYRKPNKKFLLLVANLGDTETSGGLEINNLAYWF